MEYKTENVRKQYWVGTKLTLIFFLHRNFSSHMYVPSHFILYSNFHIYNYYNYVLLLSM